MNLKSYTAETNQGPFLQINEDGFDYDVVNNIYMVFDGFGGSGIGDVAVTNLKNYIKSFYTRFCEDPDSTMPFYYSPKYLIEGNALINSTIYAHKLLCKNNLAQDISKRGGASAVLLSMSENIITLVSVGNCATYLFRKGQTQEMIAPDNHSFLAQNDYSPQFYTTPMSAFGLFDDIHYRVTEYRPVIGDTLCVLTDGVYSRLDIQEINHVLSQSNLSGQYKISQLFEMSNKKENVDNQTALLLQF